MQDKHNYKKHLVGDISMVGLDNIPIQDEFEVALEDNTDLDKNC